MNLLRCLFELSFADCSFLIRQELLKGFATGTELLCPVESGLPDLLQHIVDGATLRFTLMLIKVGLELLFSFIGVEQKLLARPEGQLADIAKRCARCSADEAHDLKVPVWHGNHHCRRRYSRQIPSYKQNDPGRGRGRADIARVQVQNYVVSPITSVHFDATKLLYISKC